MENMQDRKPSSLKKDPDEDVVSVNNHDSTDMEEDNRMIKYLSLSTFAWLSNT
jgi:hypothetical protein